MVLRNIVKIDEEKCNGCGLCITACAEGAIELVNGKAKLVSDIYCDGLGACLSHCPQDAITIEQRQAEQFDLKATEKHLTEREQSNSGEAEFVCPGMINKKLREKDGETESGAIEKVPSQLTNWPVQLKLLSLHAPFLKKADLLVVADCVPFAMGDFHNTLLKNSAVAVGCPKLDDADLYIQKLTEILKIHDLSSLKVIHMQVPCCSGLTEIIRRAIKNSAIKISFEDITISLQGEVVSTKTINP